MDYETLLQEVHDFAIDKDFVKHHKPKNLAIALSVEASELLEHFMWSDKTEFNKQQKKEISYEMADVFIYLMHLSNAMDVDLLQATAEKMEINQKRF